MSELNYRLTLDNKSFVDGMAAARSQVAGLAAELRPAATNLNQVQASSAATDEALAKLTAATEKLSTGLQENTAATAASAAKLDALAESTASARTSTEAAAPSFEELTAKLDELAASAAESRSSLDGLGTGTLSTAGALGATGTATGIAAGALGTLAGAAVVVTGALAGAKAILEASGTEEATATLDDYTEAWENLTEAAGEAKTGLAQALEPIATFVISKASGMVNQLARDLRGVTGFLGLTPLDPGRFDADNAARAERARIRDEERTEAQRLAQDKADLAQDNAKFAADLDEERLRSQAQIDARRAAEAAAASQRNAAREAAAQEAIFEDTLSREANLKRRIAALRGQGPNGAAAVNALPPGSDARAAAAERTALLVSLQKQLADLKAKEAEQAERAAAAIAKAAAAESLRLAAMSRRILEENRAKAQAAAPPPARRGNILDAQETAAARAASLRQQIAQRQSRGETIGSSMRLALESAVRRAGDTKPPVDPQLKKLDALASIDARLADLGLAN